jgi:hypothetical protein
LKEKKKGRDCKDFSEKLQEESFAEAYYSRQAPQRDRQFRRADRRLLRQFTTSSRNRASAVAR